MFMRVNSKCAHQVRPPVGYGGPERLTFHALKPHSALPPACTELRERQFHGGSSYHLSYHIRNTLVVRRVDC